MIKLLFFLFKFFKINYNNFIKINIIIYLLKFNIIDTNIINNFILKNKIDLFIKKNIKFSNKNRILISINNNNIFLFGQVKNLFDIFLIENKINNIFINNKNIILYNEIRCRNPINLKRKILDILILIEVYYQLIKYNISLIKNIKIIVENKEIFIFGNINNKIKKNIKNIINKNINLNVEFININN